MLLRLSQDGGQSWSQPTTIRTNYQADEYGDVDFGYPRLYQAADGSVIVVYYWADAERPQHHITATRWHPTAE
jgi:hypothetical protein